MLAVQRPSMGSSKPPNPDMLFGYHIEPNPSNFPFPSPTAPAPGPALLDDNESKFLDSFFDGVSSDQFDYNLFPNAPESSSDIGFGWTELPPTFMGTTSSFGQQPQLPSFEVPETHLHNGINAQAKPEASLPPTTSADVLAAATLLQSGSMGRSHSMVEGTLFQHQEVSAVPSNGHSRSSISHFPPPQTQKTFSANTGRDSSDQYPGVEYFSDLFFHNPNKRPQPKRPVPKAELSWGSDAAFGASQGFMAPQDHDKKIEDTQKTTLKNAFLPASAENSRPPSPGSAAKAHQRIKSLNHINTEAERDQPPRKRRKSKAQDDEEDENDSPITPTYRKKKSNKKGAIDSQPADNGRRKSTATASKTVRENLTEDQKRENHIKSEQKRRTLIREGFEDLGELVPGLKGGGFSKSAVLVMAADWLEDLLQGNAALRERLDQMEGRI